MTKKETKFYMAGTDDEVQLGDVIECVLTKKMRDGHTLHKREAFRLTEASLPYALEIEVIEQREVEVEVDNTENPDLIDFGGDNEEDGCPCGYGAIINEMIKDHEELEQRVDELEENVKELMETNMKYLKEILKEAKSVNKSNGKKGDTK